MRSGSLSEDENEDFTEIFSWGNDNSGQLGLGPKHSKGYKSRHSLPRYCSFNVSVVQMACGQDHTVFITAKNLVYSMGSNAYGQLGISEAPRSTSNKYSPILIEDLLQADPFQVECGNNHSLVLTRLGTVFTWGSNKYGQCGQGSSVDMTQTELCISSPYHLRIGGIMQIDCGADHSAVVDNSGRVYTFGCNKFGQLGVGSFNDEFSP